MPNDVYTSSADLSQVLTEIRRFVDILGKLVQVQVQVQGQLDKVTTTIDAQNNQFLKYNSTVSDGIKLQKEFNLTQGTVKTTITNTTAALERQRLAQEALNKSQVLAKSSAQVGVGMIRTLAPTGAMADRTTQDEQINYNLQLRKLQELTAAHNTSATQIVRAWNMARVGALAYSNVHPLIQKQILATMAAEEARGATARDIYARTSAALIASADRDKKAIEQNQQATQNYLITWQSFARLLTIQLLHQAISQLSQALKQGVKDAMEFQTRIAEIRTISQDAALSSEAWAGGLRKISESMGIDILDTAEAAYQTLSNQIAKGAKVFDFVTEAARLASITVSKNSEAVDALSSVMNAYGKEAGTAREISDRLFVSVNLGRFRLEEIANSLGGITVIGKEAGLSLNELLSALNALTISGFTSSQAMTQIRGVISQLIKPSQDMKKFLTGIGAASGEAAVKMYGFIGVLDLLRQHADASGKSISEEIRNIRGLLAALNLTSAGHRAYAESMTRLANASTEANEAFKIVMETNARTIQKEMEKVKNYFRLDFGTNILKTLAETTQSFGGLANVIKTTMTFIATAIPAAILIAIVRINMFRKEVVLTEAAMQQAALSARAFRASLAIFALVEAVMLGVRAWDAWNEKQAAAMEKFRTDTAERKKELEGLFTATVQPVKTLLTDTFTMLNVKIGEGLARINANIEVAKEGAKDVAKIIDESIGFMTSNLREQLGEVHKSINDVVRVINDARAFIQSTKKDFENFNRDLKVQEIGEDPAKKLEFLQSELKRLNKEVSGVENIDQLKDLRSQLLGTLKEIARLQNDIDKKNITNAKARHTAEIALREATEKRGRQEASDIAKIDALRRKPRTQANREALDRALEAQKEHKLDLKQAQEKAQEELKEHTKVEVKKIDITKEASKARRLLEKKDLEIGGKAAVDLVKTGGLFDKETTFEANILRLKELGQELSRLDFSKILATEDPKRLKQFFDERVKFIEELMTVYKEKLSMVPELETKKLEEIVRQLAQEKLAVTLKLEEKPRLEATSEQSQKALQGFNESAEQLRQSQERAQNVRSNLESTIAEAFKKTIDVVHTPFGKNPNQLALETALSQIKGLPEKTNAIIAGLSPYLRMLLTNRGNIPNFDQIKQLEQAIFEETDITNKLKEMTDRARATFANLGGDLSTFAEKVKAAGVSTPFAINNMNTAFDETTKALYDFKVALGTFNIPKAPESEFPPRKTESLGGLIMAGSDNVPALLNPGEFVMNAASSRKFYSQLVAMNSVGRFSGGGLVGGNSTTVGDINVSMKSSGNESIDVIRLGKLLQREIKRGTVSLS